MLRNGGDNLTWVRAVEMLVAVVQRETSRTPNANGGAQPASRMSANADEPGC